MNTITKCIYVLLGTLALAWLAISSVAQAVLPPPDGGYPGFNTAEGQNALFDLTTGSANTAVGWHSLSNNSEGSFNTATGAGALLFNTADNNTAFGAVTLLFNTTGISNTALGAAALLNNTQGTENTATGHSALRNNITGNANTATGDSALRSNTTGGGNTANGVVALSDNTTGGANTATGEFALLHNTTGSGNTANGFFTLTANTAGINNTANGVQALRNNNTGNNNIALGRFAGDNVTTADNVICIGAEGENVNDTCYIGQIFGRTSSGGTAVFVNSTGRLGTTTSSERFKDDIKPMDQASEALFALRPVIFRYKKEIDPQGSPQWGLVAEEVEKVNPDLVVRDGEGKVNTVRYEAVNAMLLNEFLKEHKTVQEQRAVIAEIKSNAARQEATIVQQQKQIEALSAGLQKVNGQLEASKPAPHLVNNP